MFENSSPARYVFPVIVAALVFFGVTYFAKRFYEEQVGFHIGGAHSSDEGLLEHERNTIEVFHDASPAVVFVHNLQNYRSFLSFEVSEVQSGTGSGFLWDERGHIVTNLHVVQDADRVAVTLIDGNTYEADLIGFEPRKDLAVLKIELQSTNVLTFNEKVSNSNELQVGQKAIAIGNPYGLDHTLTVGSVSAIGRSMSSIMEDVTIRDMIQTDAAINLGNSGGPLLDSSGRLIGMNTLILKNSNGIGFAVPSNTIKRVVSQIIKYGKPIQAGIGIRVFSDRDARKLGLRGVVVLEVYKTSPAEEAGIRGTTFDEYGRIVFGDTVKAIDGVLINNYDDMYNALELKNEGDTVELTYLREGQESTLEIPMVTVRE